MLRLVAVDGDRWVGLTILQPVTPELAWNAITGVVPSHRGRRLARALKVLAAEDARRRGVRWIATRNNARNAPMLAVNEALGVLRGESRTFLTPEAARRNYRFVMNSSSPTTGTSW